MTNTNIVIIAGNLTRDAELKYTISGTACTKFSVAVNRSVKKGDAWEDRASFFEIVLWGKYGESMEKYLTKGQKVIVTGYLNQDRWEVDGKGHSKITICAEHLELAGGKRDNNAPEPRQEREAAPRKEKGDIGFGTAPLGSTKPVSEDGFDDDLPFN